MRSKNVIIVAISVILILLLVGLTIYFLLSKESSDSDNDGKEITSDRLPRDVIPYHYVMHLKPNISGDQLPLPYSGEVTIHFTVKVTTKTITLTCDDLKLDRNSIKFLLLSASNDFTLPVLKEIRHDTTKQFIHLDVEGKFISGYNYSVHIGYSGQLVVNSYGMYAAPYEYKNTTKYLAATQLEPIGFRRLVPGFDEVDMKATFDVHVYRRPEHTALSNTPIFETNFTSDGWVVDHFEVSPVMTPYLLCVVVGDLNYMEADVAAGDKLKVRTYTNPELEKFLYHPNKYYTYPLQKWLEKETQIPYNLNKMDHIALLTFGGAMENWGLITYSEEILLINNLTSSATGMLRSSSVIAHELAHMWYGNLVTCEWWTHLWLQEALASYYNAHPLEALGWDGNELHQIEWLMTQMEVDQTNMTDPVRIPIASPKDATNAFAKSTYDKGAAMIRMLGQIMTLPILKTTLTRYLNTYKYSVANSDQFLQVFTDQAKDSKLTYPDGSAINFKTLMDPWLDQKGFPLVRVVGNKDGTATVTQQRYLNPESQEETVKNAYKWDVPLLVMDQSSLPFHLESKTPNYWLRASQENLKILIPVSNDSWYIVNPNMNFYYRVWYDEDQRKAMSKQLEKLPTESRAQIIDDTFDLARNGYYGATDAFENTLSLGSDSSYNTWSVALEHALELEPFFRMESWYQFFRKYFSSRLELLLKNLKYDFLLNDTISTQFLRKDAVSAACWFGNQNCLTVVREMYKTYSTDPDKDSINANLLPTVLCFGVAEGTEKDWNMVSDEYQRRKKSTILDERLAYSYALTCSPRHDDLDFIFKDLTTDPSSFFNPADANRVANYLAGTDYGADLFWNYTNNNWHSFTPKLDKFRLLTTITKSWYTKVQLETLKNFVATRDSLTLNDANKLAQNVLKVDQNNVFYDSNAHSLGVWFNSHGNKTVRDFKLESFKTAGSFVPDVTVWSEYARDMGKILYSAKRRTNQA